MPLSLVRETAFSLSKDLPRRKGRAEFLWLRAQENSKKRSLSEIQSRKRRFSWRKGRQFRKNRSPFVGRRFSKSIFDKPGNGEATCAAPQVFNLSRGSFAFGPLPPVPAEILRISGRGSWKETIFVLGSEISRRKNRPAPAVHAAGDGYSAKGLRPSRAPLWGFDSRHAPKGGPENLSLCAKTSNPFPAGKGST